MRLSSRDTVRLRAGWQASLQRFGRSARSTPTGPTASLAVAGVAAHLPLIVDGSRSSCAAIARSVRPTVSPLDVSSRSIRLSAHRDYQRSAGRIPSDGDNTEKIDDRRNGGHPPAVPISEPLDRRRDFSVSIDKRGAMDKRVTTEPAKFPILLSVVMVVGSWRNEVREAVEKTSRQLAALVADYEIVLIDNQPSDLSRQVYKEMTLESGLPNLQVYCLVQPVDFEVAAWAGVENSLGDYVLVFNPMDESLEALAEGLTAAATGSDLVLFVNTTPRHRAAFGKLRALYRMLFRTLSGINLTVEAAQHRLISKRVVTYLLQQPRPATRYRALPALTGFAKKIILYQAPRHVEPSGGMMHDVSRGVRMLLSNSIAPLRLASWLGFLGAILNLIYSVYVVAIAFSLSQVAPGWTTLSLQQSGMFFLLSLAATITIEYFINDLVHSRSGTPYFVTEEFTSSILMRRRKLNVEKETPGPQTPWLGEFS